MGHHIWKESSDNHIATVTQIQMGKHGCELAWTTVYELAESWWAQQRGHCCISYIPWASSVLCFGCQCSQSKLSWWGLSSCLYVVLCADSGERICSPCGQWRHVGSGPSPHTQTPLLIIQQCLQWYCVLCVDFKPHQLGLKTNRQLEKTFLFPKMVFTSKIIEKFIMKENRLSSAFASARKSKVLPGAH